MIINNKIAAILTDLEPFKYKILKKYTYIEEFLDSAGVGYSIYYNKNTQTLMSVGSDWIQPINTEDLTQEMKLDLL